MLDRTDMEILQWLLRDSRMQWKEIGEKVHMTGQAVAARIRRMEDEGTIEGFTILVNQAKLGKTFKAFITVFMKITDHAEFQRFLQGKEEVVQAHRVSGEGCYWLEADFPNQGELNRLLDELLHFGNYRLNLSIGKVK